MPAKSCKLQCLRHGVSQVTVHGDSAVHDKDLDPQYLFAFVITTSHALHAVGLAFKATLCASCITPSRPGSSLSLLMWASKMATSDARYDVSLWRDSRPPAEHSS